MMKPEQRAIYLADLYPIKGHEQGGLMPVLIMQNNRLNNYFTTFVIAPITSNLKFKGLSTTLFLPKKTAGLEKDSVVLFYQLRTLDMSRLKKFIGMVDQETFYMAKQQMSFIF